MRFLWISLIIALGVTIGAFLIRDEAPTVTSDSPNLLDEPRHPIDEDMLAKAESVVGLQISDHELIDENGGASSIFTLAADRPVLIIATKDGCPCTIESQPYFTELAKSYGEAVAFIGLTDTATDVAKQYRIDFNIPYDIVTVTEGSIFHTLQIKQSVYVTLLDSQGKVLAQWPGYSADMLMQLDEALAEASGIEVSQLDVEMAPSKMTSGCYYEDAIRN